MARIENLSATSLKVADLTSLRRLCEDLYALNAHLLLFLLHAGQVELQVAENRSL